MKAIEYIKKLLSEDSTVSFCRHSSALAAIVMLSLDVFYSVAVWHHTGSPALPEEGTLTGQAILISSLYGTGKAGETIQKFAPKNGCEADGATPKQG